MPDHKKAGHCWNGIDVPTLLTMDPLGDDAFSSRHNQRNVNGMLFGGQVMAQALSAAAHTVEGRSAHSLHAYFLRPGSCETQVIYRVNRLRDGRNFSMRRVVATQNDVPILELNCSFCLPQRGFEHQMSATPVADPETLQDLAAIACAGGADLPNFVRDFIRPKPFEVRPLKRVEVTRASGKLHRQFWWRVPSAAVIADPTFHTFVLAYMSDFWLNGVSLSPHVDPCPSDRIFGASIDHAMWFHRPTRVNEWLLYDTDSPSAHNGITVSRGLIFDRQGVLIASCVQESLQVQRNEKADRPVQTVCTRQNLAS